MIRFTHERRVHAPSHPVVAIRCQMCGETTTAHILMRRVVKHMEQLKSPVRVTVRRSCRKCHAKLSTPIRVNLDRTIDYEGITTHVDAFGDLS